MTAQTTAVNPAREGQPTREAPDLGCIYHKKTGVNLSNTAYWIEDGLHVISSTEFDLQAEDETEELAVTQFVDEAYDLCRALLALVQTDEATLQERELAGKLSDHFFEVSQKKEEMERQKRPPLVAFPRLQRRRDPHADWRRGSSTRTKQARALTA